MFSKEKWISSLTCYSVDAWYFLNVVIEEKKWAQTDIRGFLMVPNDV